MSQMGDRRRFPFFIVTKPATAAIERHFYALGRGALPQARSVYMAIVELANDARSETFEKPRKVIAEKAGLQPKALDKYVEGLEACGVLDVERIKAEGLNLPNRWTLTDPPMGDSVSETPPVVEAPPSVPKTPGVASSGPEGGGVEDAPTTQEAPQALVASTTESPTQKKGKKPSPPDRDALPEDFPEVLTPALDQVMAILQRVADARGAEDPARASVARAIASRPRRPHVKVAESLEHWAVFGRGARRPVKDVVARWRGWLDDEPDVKEPGFFRTGERSALLDEAEPPSWAEWVDENMPKDVLESVFMRSKAIWHCSSLAGGRHTVTVERVLEHLAQYREPEVAAQ